MPRSIRCYRFCRSRYNTVRLAVRAELVEAHSPFDRLGANELKRTALGLGIRENPAFMRLAARITGSRITHFGQPIEFVQFLTGHY